MFKQLTSRLQTFRRESSFFTEFVRATMSWNMQSDDKVNSVAVALQGKFSSTEI
jgi:hypothetical protein